jgi:HNH endonuclease/AP2 domain
MDNFVCIPLTQGKEAIVDADMKRTVSALKWRYNGGTSKHTGYAQTQVHINGKRRTVHMHRFVWEQVHGPIPDGLSIDHINGNGLDNRIQNLRLADQRLQSINSVHRRAGLTSSQYPGVNRDHHAQKWTAHITANYTHYHLGCFDDELEAYKAYLEALKAYSETGEIPSSKPTTSKYKGVHWRTREQKWAACIQIYKVRYDLGFFANEIDAHRAYQAASKSYSEYGILPPKGRVVV